MRWVARVLALMVMLAAGAASAQEAPVKLALVIGNADYDGNGIDVSPAAQAASAAAGYVPDLANPLNDASDIRDALTAIGFRVDFAPNADAVGMSTALATFGAKVAEAPEDAQVVIYYAGHAMQIDGVNYLIPVKAKLPAVDYSRMPSLQANAVIESVAVPVWRVVDQFRTPRAPGVNLLILDSCRNNPWDQRIRGVQRAGRASGGGMAQVAAPDRTIISFSTSLFRTAEDGTGRNSPFAEALKVRLGQSGTIPSMLDSIGEQVSGATGGRQTPWFQSASVGQACLASCVQPDQDRIDFLAAAGEGTMEAYDRYLKAHVTSAYAPYAIDALAELRRSAAVSAPQGSTYCTTGYLVQYFELDDRTLRADRLEELRKTGKSANRICFNHYAVVATYSPETGGDAGGVLRAYQRITAVMDATRVVGLPGRLQSIHFVSTDQIGRMPDGSARVVFVYFGSSPADLARRVEIFRR